MSIDRREFLLKSMLGALLATPGLYPLRVLAEALGDKKLTPNRYLSGNFAPILDEVSLHDLKVIGKIPSDLNGLFVRNGPNPIFPPTPYHWFDGDGMLHGLYLKDGKASYINRFIQTEGYLKEKAAKRCLYGGLIAGPPVKDVANISVVWHHGKMLAMWEGDLPHLINPKNLKTVGRYDFQKKVSHPFTAHPKIDPETGELIFFGYDIEKSPYVHYGVADKSGRVVHSTTIDIPRPVMMHDFAITKNYSIFMDLPLTFTPALKWQPEHGARIGLLPRKAEGSKIRWFSISPGWVYHTSNAFEDGNKVTLLACRRQDWPKSPSLFYQWVFDLDKGTVSEKQLDDVMTEFPTVSSRVVGKNAQFGYMAGLGEEEADKIIKYNLKTGTSEKHSFGINRHGGETIFVPSVKSSSEDDGYLLNFVYDKASNLSEAVILSANDFKADPIARILLPTRVPYGLHGLWIPGIEES